MGQRATLRPILLHNRISNSSNNNRVAHRLHCLFQACRATEVTQRAPTASPQKCVIRRKYMRVCYELLHITWFLLRFLLVFATSRVPPICLAPSIQYIQFHTTTNSIRTDLSDCCGETVEACRRRRALAPGSGNMLHMLVYTLELAKRGVERKGTIEGEAPTRYSVWSYYQYLN